MFLSEILAISAAACIALSGMIIGELAGRVPLLVLTRWQMVASFLMTGAASLAVGGWSTIAPWQAGALALSSLFGIIIASTTYFAAIFIAGPRQTALLFSLTAPFALLSGYLWLGETVSAQQGFGIALDAPPDLMQHLTAVAQKIGQAIQASFRPEKVGLMIAGLEVRHVHLHLVPIKSLGDLDFAKADANAAPESLDAAAEKLRAALRQAGHPEAAEK